MLTYLMGQLRQVVGLRAVEALEDEQLIARFTAERDEAAFAALVQRYGPLVYGVCRRVLADTQLAEDASQATFLVLARHMASIRKRGALGGWLYEVAYHLALKAKRAAVRRRAREQRDTAMITTDETAAVAWQEVRPILDEELGRLPAKYRVPLVLCYFQGKSNREVARELGWPIGSMSRRLDRARQVLHDRLVRRGVALPAGGCAALAAEAATAAPPPDLIAATAHAGSAFASAGGTQGPTAALLLANGMLHALLLRRILMTVLVTALTAALGWIGWQAVAGRAALPDLPAPPPASAALALAPLPPDRPRLPGLVRLRPPAPPQSLAFAADGETLLAMNVDQGVRRWNVFTGKEQAPLALGDEEQVLAVSPDGMRVAVTKYIKRREGGPAPKVLNLERQMLIVRDSASGKMLMERVNHGPLALAVAAKDRSAPECLGLFSANGAVLAVVHIARGRMVEDKPVEDGVSVDLWNIAAGTKWTPGRPARVPRSQTRDLLHLFAFSPDGKWFAQADNSLRVWDVPGAKLAVEYEPKGAKQAGVPWEVAGSPAFLDDGATLVFLRGGPTNQKNLWANRLQWLDIAAQRETRTVPCPLGARWTGHEAYGSAVPLVLNASGRFLAAGSTDGTVSVWNTATGEEVVRYTEHRSRIAALAFAREGNLLASGSTDSTIVVRDIVAIHADQRRLEAAWSCLAEFEARQVERAMADFLKQPDRALEFLGERVQPVPAADPDHVKKLIADLESDRPETWQRAAAALEQLGEQVDPALENLGEGATNVSRTRADAIRHKIDVDSHSPWSVRQRRAVTVLERLGTAEALQFLRKLAEGAPGAALTGEAKKALARLEQKKE